MCVFCVAVPATLAVGVNLSAKPLHERYDTEKCGERSLKRKNIPIGKISFIVAGLLMVAAAVFHSQLKA
ncbi:MAG: hypothetical protein PVF83_17515 [Anaerolineales bacterium]|jgi:hypothetical protein